MGPDPSLDKDQEKLIRTTARHYAEEGEWPTYLWLDRQLKDEMNVVEVAGALPQEHARNPAKHWRPEERLELRLPALHLSGEAVHEVDGFMTALKVAVQAYYEAEEEPQLTSEALKEAGLDRQMTEKLREFLWSEMPFLKGGSHKEGEWWFYRLEPSVRRFRHVETIDEYLELTAQRETDEPAEDQTFLSRVLSGLGEGGGTFSEIRRSTAFIMMWMDSKQPELQDVHLAIKDVCEEFEIDAFRIDEIEHSDRITKKVLKSIRESEFLIADLTGARPNVYYEVGYAHALGKRPILYRKAGTDLHFDLQVHNVPEYANVTELKELLRARLEAMTGRGPEDT